MVVWICGMDGNGPEKKEKGNPISWKEWPRRGKEGTTIEMQCWSLPCVVGLELASAFKTTKGSNIGASIANESIV